MNDKKIIAVDFDGTCVEHEYPAIGFEVDGAVETLQALTKQGHKIILYSMRSGEKLDKAVKWFKDRKVELWGINKNPEQKAWTDSPKVYADIYIDDAALGCPIMFIDGAKHPVVDWAKVRTQLEYDGVL